MQTQLRACFVCYVDSEFYTSAHNQSRREVKPKAGIGDGRSVPKPGHETTSHCVLGQQKEDLAWRCFCAKTSFELLQIIFNELLLIHSENHISGSYLDVGGFRWCFSQKNVSQTPVNSSTNKLICHTADKKSQNTLAD